MPNNTAHSRHEGFHEFVDEASFAAIFLPDSCVGNSEVTADADERIESTKMVHRNWVSYAQNHGSAVVDQRTPVHVVSGQAGTLIGVKASLVVACVGDSTVDVQIKVNGSNVLTAAIQFTDGEAAFDVLDAAGFTDNELVEDDVIEVDINATVGTGTLGQGIVVTILLDEDPS